MAHRNVTVGLTLGVTVLVPVLAAYETLREDLPVRPCLFILSTSVLLVRLPLASAPSLFPSSRSREMAAHLTPSPQPHLRPSPRCTASS